MSEDLAYAVHQRTAAWLGAVLRISALVLAASGIAALVTRSAPVWWIYGAFATTTLVALVLQTLKRTQAAGILLSLGFWAVSTLAVLFLGGVRSPGTFVYLPVVITAGLFWSWRASAGLAVASLLVVISAAWLDAYQALPVPLQPPTAGPLLRIFAGSLTMTAVLVGVALHSLRGALADVRRYALRTEELLLDAPNVIAVFDRLGIVMAVGPSLADVTGYEPNELVAKHVTRVGLFGHERRLATDAFKKLVGSKPGVSPELRLVGKDGAVLWGEARLHSFALDNGEALVRVVLYDVTRRKLAEERQAQLERRVERGRRLEAMGLLVGGATHDLNNLLTVILSVSSVLDAKLPDDPETRELVRDLNDSAHRAAALARRLLAARPAEEAEPVDLTSQIEALRPVLARLVGDKIKLVVRGGAGPCFVRADPTHLEQIALNLAVNARDAMPNGGELVVHTSRRLGEEGACGSPWKFVELSVTDSGVGMDAATQDRMFEAFYTTKGRGGTGLGLALVDGLVTRLGGHIRVESHVGRGTRIDVLLPEVDSSEVSQA